MHPCMTEPSPFKWFNTSPEIIRPALASRRTRGPALQLLARQPSSCWAEGRDAVEPL